MFIPLTDSEYSHTFQHWEARGNAGGALTYTSVGEASPSLYIQVSCSTLDTDETQFTKKFYFMIQNLMQAIMKTKSRLTWKMNLNQ